MALNNPDYPDANDFVCSVQEEAMKSCLADGFCNKLQDEYYACQERLQAGNVTPHHDDKPSCYMQYYDYYVCMDKCVWVFFCFVDFRHNLEFGKSYSSWFVCDLS